MQKKEKPVKYRENMEEVLNKELRFHLENPFRKEDAIYHMDLAVEGCSGYAQDIIDRIKAGKLEGSKGKWHARKALLPAYCWLTTCGDDSLGQF